MNPHPHPDFFLDQHPHFFYADPQHWFIEWVTEERTGKKLKDN
jgi:hypothetical protein